MSANDTIQAASLPTPKMDPEAREVWLEALRSGQYEQGQHALKYHNKYCCLGVLCAVTGQGKWAKEEPAVAEGYEYAGCLDNELIPEPLAQRFGLTKPVQAKLAALNDEDDRDFQWIATWIEGNL